MPTSNPTDLKTFFIVVVAARLAAAYYFHRYRAEKTSANTNAGLKPLRPFDRLPSSKFAPSRPGTWEEVLSWLVPL
jgi:hypothetical protein